MKKQTTLILIILFCNMLYSQVIGSITNISNGNKLIEYDNYNGTILRYSDRMIVRNTYSLSEFQILPNGHLQRIGYYEAKEGLSEKVVIDEDRLYVLNFLWNLEKYHMTVYDLSTKPMQEITNFMTDVYYRSTILFTKEHIVMTDYDNRRALLINKTTFQEEGYIDGLYGVFCAIVDSVLLTLMAKPLDGGNIEIYLSLEKIIDLYTLNLEEISQVTLPIDANTGVLDMEIQSGKVVITHLRGSLVVDIDDILNPVVIYDIPLDSKITIESTLYTEDYLFRMDYWGYFFAYLLGENGEYSLVYSEQEYLFSNFRRNMYFQSPLLYVNTGHSLTIYDVSDNFKEVASYGQSVRLSSFLTDNSDFYYTIFDPFENTMSIYSSLNNSLFCVVNYGELEVAINKHFRSFHFKDDHLYVKLDTDQYTDPDEYIEIYYIEGQQAYLISRLKTDWGPFYIIDDKVFLMTRQDVMNIIVYDIIDYKLVYQGSFPGRLISPAPSLPKNAIISYNNGRIYFRDISDYTKILFDTPISLNYGLYPIFYYIEGDYILFIDEYAAHTIYKYDIDNGIFSFRHAFRPEKRVNTFNNILIDNAEELYISTYFSFINDEVVNIGEKHDNDIAILGTYFFPESKKMVQRAGSGVFVYDFDYKLPDLDPEIKQPKTRLFSNYPNPFNPETNISFEIAKDGHVAIDIYNIRGQKVKSLLNDNFTSGEHFTVWNGTDDNGQKMGSGIYLYRMVSDDATLIKKMVLLK